MRKWIVALSLVSCFAQAAFAGRGPHAQITGPGPDGVTYTARIASTEPGDVFEPWALAEGVVDSTRRSVLLRVEPTAEHGVYTFRRRWPAEGRWMVRFNLGSADRGQPPHQPAPATIVTIGQDGSVQKNQTYRKTDGSTECSRTLRPFQRASAGKRNGSDEGC